MPFLKSLCQYLEYFICTKAFEAAVVDDALHVELGAAKSENQQMRVSVGKVAPGLKLLFGGKVSLTRSPNSYDLCTVAAGSVHIPICASPSGFHGISSEAFVTAWVIPTLEGVDAEATATMTGIVQRDQVIFPEQLAKT